jgi:hypothetical protein
VFERSGDTRTVDSRDHSTNGRRDRGTIGGGNGRSVGRCHGGTLGCRDDGADVGSGDHGTVDRRLGEGHAPDALAW